MALVPGGIAKNCGFTKGAIGGKARILLAGHGSGAGSSLFSKASISHCDGGIAGAKVLSFGCGSIWKGLLFGVCGLGVAIGEIAPALVFVAGAGTAYGLLKWWKRQPRKVHNR